MNQLVIKEQNGDLTMSSRDIAELCDKRHDHVMRDIRMMLDELSLSPYLGYEENQTLRILYDAHTKRAREYHLPRLRYGPVAIQPDEVPVNGDKTLFDLHLNHLIGLVDDELTRCRKVHIDFVQLVPDFDDLI